MSTLFLVPLLYGGQEQIVRQMRDELLNSSREVQKEAKAASWSAWRSFRLELDLLCFFVCYRQDEEASLAAGGSSRGL